jgi:hypothetical protein
MKIKTFGAVDQRSLEQLDRCMEAGNAAFGVLCADHHAGYAQPIGGGIAYEGYVSPSGVGFDIGCIASGTRVTTCDGSSVAIEEVTADHAVACVDRGRFRPVRPNLGAVRRGPKPVLRISLANGRVPAKGSSGETCPRHPDARLRKVRAEIQLTPGVVDWPAVQARLREQGIVLVGGGADEAPEVYKRLPEVLAAHRGTIRVKHTLRPLGVAMAGRDVHDPYKD